MERIKQDASGTTRPDVWGGTLLGLDIEEVDGYGRTINITFRDCSMAVAGVWGSFYRGIYFTDNAG